MLKTIEQSVYFPISPARLYAMYLSSHDHAAFTGMPVDLDARVGGKFHAFGGMLEGSFLQLLPNKLIVQRWRSSEFHKADLDSTLILTFNKKGKGCQLDLVHVNVPKHDFKGVTEGWPKYYWEPLRSYLKPKK